MKAIIRDCKKNDLPDVLELIKTCGLFWEIGDRIDVFEKKLKHDPKSIIVLEVGEKIVGSTFFTYDPWSSFT